MLRVYADLAGTAAAAAAAAGGSRASDAGGPAAGGFDLVLASEVVCSTDGMLRLQVWDPKNATTVGEPFDVPVARRVVERVNRPRPLDAPEPAVYVLDGVFTPSLRVNERRTEVGAFDNPRFVGPMVELSWAVDAKSVGPWSAPEATAVAEDVD